LFPREERNTPETTIGNPGTLEGMLYGNVRRIWARTHHPKWYKKVGGEMSRTADKIAHLRKTAFEHKEGFERGK
jgi:hypothetical protein